MAEAIICLAGVILSPFSLWYLAVRRRAKLALYGDRMEVTHFRTRRIAFAEIERLGVLAVPFRPMGLRGWMETNRCGGKEAIYLCIKHKGKTSSFLVSQYESWQEILDVLQVATELPYENVESGFASLKWPKQGDRPRR